MSEPISITMTDITFDIDSGSSLTLKRCEQCKTLMLPDDAQGHANWHANVTRSVGNAGMGFGAGLFGGGVL